MIIVILSTVEIQPEINSQEAVLLLTEYDRLSDDSVNSHKAAVAVTRALEALSQASGVPMWWLCERPEYAGDETPETLRKEWDEWQEWRHDVPEMNREMEEDDERIPF